MAMFKSGCESSDDCDVCNETLLPRLHSPVFSTNWNAEHPMVDMHIVVQCTGELDTKICNVLFQFFSCPALYIIV